MSTDLKTIVNAPQPLVLSDGRTLDITPIRVKELPAFIAALEPIFGMVSAGASVTTLLAQNSEAVIAATAVGLRLPRAEVDEFGLDDLVTGAAKVMEVNADFFARRVLPALNQTTSQMSSLMAGLMPSIGSSPADTGSAT